MGSFHFVELGARRTRSLHEEHKVVTFLLRNI